MNRRQLLKRGLFGGLLLAGAGLAAWPPRGAAHGELRALSARAHAILAALAARIVPGSDGVALATRIDASLAGMPEAQLSEFHQLVSLFDNALVGLLFEGRATPFSRLSPEAQDARLEAWRSSSWVVRRSGYQLLRRLCLAVHYGDRSTHAAIGYPGPRPTGGIFYDDSKAGT
jgi:hypothetical protein